MNFKKAFSLLSLLLALAVSNANTNFRAIDSINTITSSPTVEFTPNGDRVSHFPPYFQSDN